MQRRFSSDASEGHTLEHWPRRDVSSGHTLQHWGSAKQIPEQKQQARAEPANLNGVLDEIVAKCDNDDSPDSLTLDEILESVGRRSYGPLLLVIGLFAISPATVVPG